VRDFCGTGPWPVAANTGFQAIAPVFVFELAALRDTSNGG